MNIEKNPINRDKYLDLLLIADEQIEMLQKYMYQGDLFVFSKMDIIGVCIVLPIDKVTCELKNISIATPYQKQGYGKKIISYLLDYYKNTYSFMIVGTGANTSTVSFYKSCGFKESHLIKDFFIKNYNHPMFENNIQLKDMQYLKRSL